MPLPPGFVPPCLPTKAPQPPSGDVWLHEIKHDGFRIIARKDGNRVRLYSRPGNDLNLPLPADRRVLGSAPLALLHHQRRAGGLRRQWHARLRSHPVSAP
jgi:ATP-dependent DNA ligase